MANRERNLLDDVARRVREWAKELEQVFNPPQPERVRVPVPINIPQDPRRNPYR